MDLGACRYSVPPPPRRASPFGARRRKRSSLQGRDSPRRTRQLPGGIPPRLLPCRARLDRPCERRGLQPLGSGRRSRTSSPALSCSIQEPLDLVTHTPDAVSFVPVNLSSPKFPAGNAATPFSLRQRPRPYRFRKRERARIDLPTAMVSMSVIDPMISKYISPHCRERRLPPCIFSLAQNRRYSEP